MFKSSIPVAFIIFNRPNTTERVFAEIAKAKPPKLLVVADGPRSTRPGEEEKCAAARAIVERVDWDCEVLTNYSDINLGCKHRVSSGIDWVFQQVEEAIILEDDCLPHPTFFRFCEEMLNRYRDDERISMISGDNFQSGRRYGDSSYYFSRYAHIWGWASWRRAWQNYDRHASSWPDFLAGRWIDSWFRSAAERTYWKTVMDMVFRDKIDTWDYQWVLSAWLQGMVSIMPQVNMVSNIGFGAGATHTRRPSPFGDLLTYEMEFPLKHPKLILPELTADAFTAKRMFKFRFPIGLYARLRLLYR